jgi:hypothetical protein
VKKLTGDFDNGLGAELIDEHSLASFRSKKSREGISGLFQQYRPVAVIGCPNLLRCEERYWITSSAVANSVSGRVRPSAFAVLRLMTNSNFAGNCTGNSLTFAPRKMRST